METCELTAPDWTVVEIVRNIDTGQQTTVRTATNPSCSTAGLLRHRAHLSWKILRVRGYYDAVLLRGLSG